MGGKCACLCFVSVLCVALIIQPMALKRRNVCVCIYLNNTFSTLNCVRCPQGKSCVSVPGGSPAIDCGCMDQELLGTEVVLMTRRADHNKTYLPRHLSDGH